MKKLLLFAAFLFLSLSFCKAQSNELKTAFSQASTTLKEYKFKSEDVYDDGHGMDFASTKSISIKLQGGYMILTIVDDFADFTDPIFGYRHGAKTIKAPIAATDVLDTDLGDGCMYLYCEEGLEFSYKGQKELLEQYGLHSTPLNAKKLYRELGELLSIAKAENFRGSLGASQSTTGQRPARRRR